MKRVFTLAVLAAATTAWGDPPNERRVQEITDLRAEVGPATAYEPEFVEAVRQQFKQNSQQPPQGSESHGRAGAYSAPMKSAQPGLQTQYDGFVPAPVRTPWPGMPAPPPAPVWANRVHEAPRDPKALLRHSAADLDRLANDLEGSELYAEADSLREAAGMLRRAARSRPGHSPTSADAAGPSIERMKARVQNAMADAQRRQAEVEARLAAAQEKLRAVEARARAAIESGRAAEQRALEAEVTARRAMEQAEAELPWKAEERPRRFRDHDPQPRAKKDADRGGDQGAAAGAAVEVRD